MKLVIKIDCDNEAFQNGYLSSEIDSLLRDVSHRIRNQTYIHDKWNNLLDLNGNMVGKYKLADDEHWEGEQNRAFNQDSMPGGWDE